MLKNHCAWTTVANTPAYFTSNSWNCIFSELKSHKISCWCSSCNQLVKIVLSGGPNSVIQEGSLLSNPAWTLHSSPWEFQPWNAIADPWWKVVPAGDAGNRIAVNLIRSLTEFLPFLLLAHQTNTILIYGDAVKFRLTLSALVRLLLTVHFASIENPDKKIYGIHPTLEVCLTCSRLWYSAYLALNICS